MTISLVGSAGNSRAGSTSTTTQSLTGLAGGSNSSPSAGDLMLLAVFVGSASDRHPAMATPSGWKILNARVDSNGSSFDGTLATFYKYATSSESTVTIPSTGNNADAQSWVVHVFRGTNLVFSTPVSATGTGTTRFDGPSITLVNSGSWVWVAGGGADSTGVALTHSGLSDFRSPTPGVDTNDATAGAGYNSSPGSAGASYNPAACTGGGSVVAGNSWCAVTVELREAASSTLTENFSSALDSAKWDTSAGANSSVSVGSGKLSLNLSGTSTHLESAQIDSDLHFNLVGSSTYVKCLTPLTITSGSGFGVETGLQLYNTGDAIRMLVSSSGDLIMGWTIGGSFTQVAAVTYNSTNHKWWRISESGGTTSWDTAPNNGDGTAPGSWTSQGTASTSSFTAGIGNLRAQLYTTRWASGIGTSGAGEFDGLNTTANAEASSVTYSPSGGVTMGGTVPFIKGMVDTVSGGVSFAGTVPLIKTEVYQNSGGATFGGTAPMTFGGATNEYTFSVSGGVTMGATNDIVQGKVFTVSGGVAMSGTFQPIHSHTYEVSGGTVIAGTNPLLKTHIQLPSGAVAFTGTNTLIFTAAGGPDISTRLPMTGVGP